LDERAILLNFVFAKCIHMFGRLQTF